VTASEHPAISIVDADRDLADLLDESALERARREALTRVQRLSPGEWDAAAALDTAAHHRGFLIIDGLLSRTVDVLGRRCVELVGHGDVMRPWQWDDEGSHVRAEVGWTVLEPSRLAVLDHRLVLRIVPWPQLGLELFNRGTRRAHHLAVALAIAHHQRVDDRLLLTLWHLASGGVASTATGSSCPCRSAISAWPTWWARSASRSPRPRAA
jgi:CRP/FNR family transcriptional regulator, cyclic AMP receptor protein